MIEGLKAIVEGTELYSLCVQRIEHHRECLRMLNDTTSDTPMASDYLHDVMVHERREAELTFLKNHINREESYLISIRDFERLGIAQYR